MAHVRQLLANRVPADHREYADFLTGPVREEVLAAVSGWLVPWMQNWWQPADPEPVDIGSKGPHDRPPESNRPHEGPLELTVDQLVDLMRNGSDYVTHRTSNRLVGTLRANLKASDPAGDSPHAERGVYAMRGISGIPYGDWGVVFRFDGRFAPYFNGEYICRRDLARDEAVGWYHITTLQRAQAISRRRQEDL